MGVFDGISYYLSSSFPQQRSEQLAHALNINGATNAARIEDTKYVICDTLWFEGREKVQANANVYVVSDAWVDRSLVLGKIQPPQYYSADKSMIFSGIVACASELPAHDNEVLSAGITALGGQWRVSLTNDVTHLFAISPSSHKYSTAISHRNSTGIKVVLPHWFDDSVKLGVRNLTLDPYLWPDPPLLKGHAGMLLDEPEKKNEWRETEEGKAKAAMMANASAFTSTHDNRVPIPRDVDLLPVKKNALAGKKVILSWTLSLYGSRREAVEAGVKRAGGEILRYLGDDDEDVNSMEKEKRRDRKETKGIPGCHILITRWRTGKSYATAYRQHKTIATLAWLYHVEGTGHFSRPVDQLLHYPIPRHPIEGFSAHEITVTNYTGEAREYIKRIIAAMGAKFTPSMSGKNTVLIAAHLKGQKADRARAWSIPVVNHTWLEDCFVQWRNLTVGVPKYITFPDGMDFAKLLGERGVGVRGVELCDEDEGREESDSQEDEGGVIEGEETGGEGVGSEKVEEDLDIDMISMPPESDAPDSPDPSLPSPPPPKTPAKPSRSKPSKTPLKTPANVKTPAKSQSKPLKTPAKTPAKATKSKTSVKPRQTSTPDDAMNIDQEPLDNSHLMEFSDDDEELENTPDFYKAKKTPKKKVIEVKVVDEEDKDEDRSNDSDVSVPAPVTTRSSARKRQTPLKKSTTKKSEAQVDSETEEEDPTQVVSSKKKGSPKKPTHHIIQSETETYNSSIAPQPTISTPTSTSASSSTSAAAATTTTKKKLVRRLTSEASLQLVLEKDKDQERSSEVPEASRKLIRRASTKSAVQQVPAPVERENEVVVEKENISAPPPVVKEKVSLLKTTRGDARTKVKAKSAKAKARELYSDSDEEMASTSKAKGKGEAKYGKGKARAKAKVVEVESNAGESDDEDDGEKKLTNSTSKSSPIKHQVHVLVDAPPKHLSQSARKATGKSKGKKVQSESESDGLQSRRLRKMDSVNVEAGSSRTKPVSSPTKPQPLPSSSPLSTINTPNTDLSEPPAKRGAAAKAEQKLKVMMPDATRFENQMRKARKSGGGMNAMIGDWETQTRDKKRPSDAADDGEGKSVKKRKISLKGKEKEDSDVDDNDEDEGKSTKSKKRAPTKIVEKENVEEEDQGKNAVYLLTTQSNLGDSVVKALEKLGVTMTAKPSQCTHLIAPHIVRTEKFLCALAVSPHILDPSWATKSAAAKQLLPVEKYVLKDETAETKYSFKLEEAIEKARESKGKLLAGLTFYVTPKTPVEFKLLKNIVTAHGGQIQHQSPTARMMKNSPNRYVISCPADISIWRPLKSQEIPIYTSEFLLVSVLKQKLEWDNAGLRVDN